MHGGRLFAALYARPQIQLIALFFLTLVLAGCGVTWLSQDEAGTEQITWVPQRSMVVHAESLGRQGAPACFDDRNRNFYTQQHADAGGLELRVAAASKHGSTIAQLRDLKTALNNFASLHRSTTASGRPRAGRAPASNEMT